MEIEKSRGSKKRREVPTIIYHLLCFLFLERIHSDRVKFDAGFLNGSLNDIAVLISVCPPPPSWSSFLFIKHFELSDPFVTQQMVTQQIQVKVFFLVESNASLPGYSG